MTSSTMTFGRNSETRNTSVKSHTHTCSLINCGPSAEDVMVTGPMAFNYTIALITRNNILVNRRNILEREDN